jgi:hypothetical protein
MMIREEEADPTPGSSQALFQIEKNYRKEVSQRRREENERVGGCGLALPCISDRVLRRRCGSSAG